MTELASNEVLGGMKYEAPSVSVDLNQIVDYVFDSSHAVGMLVLEAENLVQQSPGDLVALISALVHLLSPEAPDGLKVLTYDALDFGCIEIRRARAVSVIPEGMLELARSMGAKIHLVRRSAECSVLVTFPAAPEVCSQEAA